MEKNNEFLSILIKNGNNWFESSSVDSFENNNLKNKKKYIKKKDEIVYNIFKDAAECTTDEFWKSILKNASENKFKRGLKFKDGIITYKSKNKIIFKTLDLCNPQKAFESFVEFVRDECGFFSISDKNLKTKKIDKIIENKININNWNKIKTYIQKNICINEYVERIKIKDNLSDLDKKNLKNIIVIGILSGYFNSKTILINDSKITEIIGLEKSQSGIYCINIKESIPINFKETQDTSDFTETLDQNYIKKNSKVSYTKIIIDFFDKLKKYQSKNI